MNLLDLILAPIYILVILLFARYEVKKNIETKAYYKYYIRGLVIKLIGAIGVCIIYSFYYGGGDTLNYYSSDITMIKLMLKSPSVFMSIMRGNLGFENYSIFDNETGLPYYFYDGKTFFVVRLTTFICLLSSKSYLVTSLLLTWFAYSGIWRLFKMFCIEFPSLTKEFAFALFYIPSVAFWGSGLLKDDITLSAICWFSYSFNLALIRRQNVIVNFIYMVIAMYLILAIKSYILYALLPGTFLWLAYSSLGNITNRIVRYLVAPLLLFGGAVSIFFLLQQLGNEMGKFNVNEILQRAVITQQDLMKDYNGGNTFDIGTFDATIPSMLSKAPIAIVSGLFRPFIWESQNIVMLVSALENTFLAIFTVVILIEIRLFNIISLVRRNPILLFTFSFAICYAFSVGLSTPNFGSLVRYRIPSIPFFLVSLILMRYYYKLSHEQASKPIGKLDKNGLLAATNFKESRS